MQWFLPSDLHSRASAYDSTIRVKKHYRHERLGSTATVAFCDINMQFMTITIFFISP